MGRGADERLVAACRDPEMRDSAIRRAERRRRWALGGSVSAIVCLAVLKGWELGSSELRVFSLFVILLFLIDIARETADLRLLRFSAILDERGATPGPTPPPADRRVGGR